MESAIPALDEQMLELAKECNDSGREFYDCVGSGGNYGTAWFNQAKIVEATGDYAYYSDMESWMHLNCFFRELDKKVTFINANFNGPDRSRAEESIDAIAAMRGLTVVVTENEDYPLPANVRRIVIPAAEYDWLSPLLNYLPMALMAGYLCEIKHEAYGRGGRDDWAATATTTLLTNSKIVIV